MTGFGRSPPVVTLFCDRCNTIFSYRADHVRVLCATCTEAHEHASLTRQWARELTGAEFRTAAVQAQRRVERRRARLLAKRNQHATNIDPAPAGVPLQPSA